MGRYKKQVKELTQQVQADPERYGAGAVRDLGWAIVEAEMLRLHVCRRLSDRYDGIVHGPEGSIDKLLMTQVEQAVGHAGAVDRWHRHRWRGRHLVEGLSLQSGAERHGRHIASATEPGGPPHPRDAGVMTYAYDLPPEIQIEVDGPIRIVRLNRPEQLNATNHDAAPRTGPPVPAGRRGPRRPGRRDHRQRPRVLGRRRVLLHRRAGPRPRPAQARRSPTAARSSPAWWRVACPVIAAVNGPAVGLGCSIVALSDVVYMAESAHLADPHVAVGLVAADGGPITWPLLTSLQLAKEYALTGDRIPAERAAQIGLVNHVVPDDEVFDQAMACAKKIAHLPRRRGRGHEAHPQHPPRAGRPGHARPRPHRRGPLVHLARAPRQHRQVPRQGQDLAILRAESVAPSARSARRIGLLSVRGGAWRGAPCSRSRRSPRARVRARAEPSSSSSTSTRRT